MRATRPLKQARCAQYLQKLDERDRLQKIQTRKM